MASESQPEMWRRSAPEHKFYKCCLVPRCISTTISTPEKLFFYVPKDQKIRKNWCIAMKRDEKKSPIGVRSTVHICEDHFNLKEDMENYWQYSLMGNVQRLRLKAGVVPNIFACQQRPEAKDKKLSSKRRRLKLMKKAEMKAGPSLSLSATEAGPKIDEILSEAEPEIQHKISESSDRNASELSSNSETDSEADGSTNSESDNESEKSEPIVNVITKLKPMYEGQDGVYCRLCLERVDKKLVTPLGEIDFNYPEKTPAFKKKKLQEAQEINEMLKLCFPFFNALIFNPSICSACLAKLKVSYEFATECRNNQRLIEKYVDINCTTERVVDINEIIETKFALSDDANSSRRETEVPILNGTPTNKISLTKQMRLVRTKRLRLGEDSPALKKQKICHKSQDENSLINSDATIELDENDSSTALQEQLTCDIQQPEVIDTSDIKKEIPIKIETHHIDYPDFVKTELDDLNIKQENERLIIGNDIDEQHSHSHRTENIPSDKTNMLLFAREPVITNINPHLEDSTSDVIK